LRCYPWAGGGAARAMRAKHHGLAILRLDKPGLSHGPHRPTVTTDLLRVVIQMGQVTATLSPAEGVRMKVQCHLCGATLRGTEQFRELVRPDHDAVYVCCDEDRCDARMAFDPVTGRAARSRDVPVKQVH